MSPDIESEELTVLEVPLVFVVKAWTEELVGAIIKVHAALGFVKARVIHVFGFIQAQHVLLDFFNFGHIFFQGSEIDEVHKGVLGVGVATVVVLVRIRAYSHIMLIFESAWRCFEGSQELFDAFYVGFGAAWFRFGLFAFLHVHLFHSAH